MRTNGEFQKVEGGSRSKVLFPILAFGAGTMVGCVLSGGMPQFLQSKQVNADASVSLAQFLRSKQVNAVSSVSLVLDSLDDDMKMTMRTRGFGNENTWSISDAEGDLVCSGSGYSSNRYYEITDCDFEPNQQYVLTCMDSWGDGWGDAYLEIDGIKYCNNTADFSSRNETFGSTLVDTNVNCPVWAAQSPSYCQTYPQILEWCKLSCASYINPRTEPVPMKMVTAPFAKEMSWNIKKAEGDLVCEHGGYASNSEFEITDCDLSPNQQYVLTCMDSAGDGWGNYAYVEIDGVQYCNDDSDFNTRTETFTV